MRQEFKPKESTAIQDLQEQLQTMQDAINYILMSSADTSVSVVVDVSSTAEVSAEDDVDAMLTADGYEIGSDGYAVKKDAETASSEVTA